MVAEIQGLPVDDRRISTRMLYELMSNLSERNFCAGWIEGWEYTLWNGLTAPGDFLDLPEREKLLALSKRVGGWIIWDHGPRFLPMPAWLELFTQKWKPRQP